MKLNYLFNRKRPYAVHGTQGGISTAITLPEDFNPTTGKCPMAILMHGFMSRKDVHPIPMLAKELAKQGIASIRFDFNAHGKSEGNFVDMTIANEIEDARAVLSYVKTLPYVSKVAFLGHSQGGVIAGMLAGMLEDSPDRPACMVQLASAAVLKDDAIAGQCMNAKYDPSNPPEYVNVMFHKLGRTFILAAQKLPVFETSALYTGPVCLVHGTEDKIVPLRYSKEYDSLYKDSVLHVIEGEGHFLRRKKAQVSSIVVDFLKSRLSAQ